jgi:hypothetical protein
MPGLGKIGAACALLACATALSACGSGDDGTIPADDAQGLLAQLGDVRTAIESGQCASATANAREFVNLVDQLPATTGTDAKNALRTAGQNLETLAQDQCSTGPTGPTGPKTTSTTSTTTPTSTTTTTTTTSSTTTTQKPPPENGGGNEGTGGGTGGGTDVGGGTGGTGGPGKDG